MNCPDCNGKGGFLLYEPGLYNNVCTTCNGYGIINYCEGDQVSQLPSMPQQSTNEGQN